MRRVAILVHGIGLKRKSERKGIGRLGLELAAHGWKPVYLPLGRYWIARVWLVNSLLARVIVAFTKALAWAGCQVICVAHSNGAAIAAEASRRGAPFFVLAFISGAVDRRPKLGPATTYVLNYYTRSDWILKVARVFQLDPDWGDAGEEKLEHDEIPYSNIPLANWLVTSHSGALQPWAVGLIAKHLAEQVKGVEKLFLRG
jgi:pimeloyl-ACP methyl ester carboxylesterase